MSRLLETCHYRDSFLPSLSILTSNGQCIVHVLCRIINELSFRLSFPFSLQQDTPSVIEHGHHKGTIYIFVIVHQPEEEWRRTNFGTSRPENKTSCSWLWNTFDYLGLSIVNDTSQPIETKLVGVNMGESVEQIVKIYGAQRIWDKNEKNFIEIN